MKKIFLVAAALIFGSATYAQTTTTTSSPTRFGLKAGVNLPKYKYSDENANTSSRTEASTNFHVTGYADVALSPLFSVQPGISLQGKGAKLYGTNSFERTEDILVVEVPVNLLLNVPAGPGKFFLGAGPYAGFNITGQVKDKGTGTFQGVNYTSESSRDLKVGDDPGDDIKVLDFGVNFLGGYQFTSGFNVGAGYGYGLTNLYTGTTSSSNAEKNNRVLSFSVGFAF